MSLQITFLRHGKADKALLNHRLHPLSVEGQEQAKRRCMMLGTPVFDLILHSELIRTKETALIVAGPKVDGKEHVTVTVPQLFMKEGDPREKAVDDAFEKLGHAPLRKYLELIPNEMKSLAVEAWLAITNEISKTEAQEVLVVGHSILTQAICMEFTGDTGEKNVFLDTVLGECQGFVLTFNEKGVVTNVELIT